MCSLKYIYIYINVEKKSYLIYKYWLKLLNTNKVRNKRNFYNFPNFELIYIYINVYFRHKVHMLHIKNLYIQCYNK